MRILVPSLLAPSLVLARFLHSIPEDTYAFPKFRVVFLNGLPVLNETAHRWLKEGLRGGHLEFLDQPSKDHEWDSIAHLKEIGSGSHTDHQQDTASPESPAIDTGNYTLEFMRMGPRDSYLCLIPQPLDNVPSQDDDEQSTDVTPARTWSLLQPLTGTCLYHRQGWFTYSYCHNDEIRQFRELPPSQTRLPGTSNPEEDPDWESYTLGRAPRIPEPGADLTVAEQSAQAVNLELARNAGSHYLVQRWSDGTICDKTGKSREVEVQFHCSMTTTDHILFVKETKTCSYVLVIHTPRLCGEPGFKSRREASEEAEIRCRQVVDSISPELLNLPAAEYPAKTAPRKAVRPPPPTSSKSDIEAARQDKIFKDLVQKAYQALAAAKKRKDSGSAEADEETEVVIEVHEDVDDAEMDRQGDRLVEALRAMGIEVETRLITLKGDEDEKKTRKKQSSSSNKKKQPAADPHRDEL